MGKKKKITYTKKYTRGILCLFKRLKSIIEVSNCAGVHGARGRFGNLLLRLPPVNFSSGIVFQLPIVIRCSERNY